MNGHDPLLATDPHETESVLTEPDPTDADPTAAADPASADLAAADHADSELTELTAAEPTTGEPAGEPADGEPTAATGAAVARPLQPGEGVLLIDSKQRRYLVTLQSGAEFHSHTGFIRHDDLIGRSEGIVVRANRSGNFLVLRPTLSDFVLKMPRGAQVIYPKDLGPLLMIADIFPGARVLESGVGSGALSMTMLRAGADVVGYELRNDFASRAVKNVQFFLGATYLDRYRVEERDTYEGIDETDLDRVVLDLPEPWQVTPHAATSLRPGGIIVAYTPTIIQAVQFRQSLEAAGFTQAETLEVLNRTWHIEGQSVRPDHRMVAHTGFLTHARRLG